MNETRSSQSSTTDDSGAGFRPNFAVPPGATLAEALEEKGMRQRELASRLGVHEVVVSDIIRGERAISAETARGLELVLGIPFSFWMRAEARYREHLARIREEEQFSRWAEWAKAFPYAEMVKLGWIAAIPAKCSSERVRSLLGFLQVSSPDSWTAVYQDMGIAYRKTKAFTADPSHLGAWLRQGERQAQTIDCLPYNRARFQEALTHIREMTADLPSDFGDRLVSLSAACGVAVVYVPALSRSRASGATRWLSPEKALIQLSLRHKSDDHFWFTFFHEAAHILKHSKKKIRIELPGIDDPKELEADKWSADFLIPPGDWRRFCAVQGSPIPRISSFAAELGISPGIVVGRLQREKQIPHSAANALKKRLDFKPCDP